MSDLCLRDAPCPMDVALRAPVPAPFAAHAKPAVPVQASLFGEENAA